ncbi:1-acyl-sn-glycerol-3-phosphate acyltransferase [Nereida sp. MMG025]|uniref:lysophospholipid acyltransferase family protein n=1 Tax=Nereida sp. MMG025 TaxID=2909981 RepID=UPI001F2E5E7D|nr:lysophospholipid acyltransferase family protein [Nereida sp. MMG025]MCF6443403.1 1-acyl-sn-glycerol-3-phosphate acyltransferase [Nereida sp. MMG025]
MSKPAWNPDDMPPLPPMTAMALVRVAWRGGILGLVTFSCLALLLLVRLIERPVFGQARPVTPFITQFVCRAAFVILGIKRRVIGEVMPHKGAIVANHSSWLDIFTLNASKRIYFVSKAEVAKWPGIGWLARATGTVFIARDPRQARIQKQMFEDRLKAGHRLLFFPEGTSTDGKRVLTFKPTLFAAFFEDALREEMWIQPVSVIYHAPKGAEPRFYGWWGDMDFAPHLLSTLAAHRQGSVDVVYHPALKVGDFADRKALAAAAEAQVRAGLDSYLTDQTIAA